MDFDSCFSSFFLIFFLGGEGDGGGWGVGPLKYNKILKENETLFVIL